MGQRKGRFMSKNQVKGEVVQFIVSPISPAMSDSVQDVIRDEIKDAVCEGGFQDKWESHDIEVDIPEQRFPVGAPVIVAVIILGGGTLEVVQVIHSKLSRKYYFNEHARYETTRDRDKDAAKDNGDNSDENR